MLSSAIVVKIRSYTRKIGLNKFIGRLIYGSRYEDNFGPVFIACIKPGDTVWDVGANVGLYTAMFLEAAGSDGRVVAFEPTPDCFARLQDQFSDCQQVSLKNIALGSRDGLAAMVLDDDPFGVTHHLVENSVSSPNLLEIEVCTAASVVDGSSELFPNAIKIDVEGHEGSVVDGLSSLLVDPRLHSVGIEVHFGILEARGESWRPQQMEKLFRSNGFTVRWTDPSHMLATRFI